MTTLSLVITDSTPWKHLFEYLRLSLSDVTLFFTRDTISIVQSNTTHSLLHQVSIDSTDELQYKLRTDLLEIGLSLKDLCIFFKSISKRDKVVLSYQEKGQSLLRCDVINGSTMTSVSHLRVKNLDYIPVESVVHPEHCNLSVHTGELTKVCNNIGLPKPIRIVVTCYHEGISFSGFATDDILLCKYDIGKTQSKEIVKHTVFPDTIRSLSKLPLMASHGSMVKFYFRQEMPIWIKCSIGIYGTYTLMLREEV